MISIPDAIKGVCRDTHVPMIEAVFGSEGVEAVFQIMDTAQQLYRQVELERVTGDVVIYRIVRPGIDHADMPVRAAADFAGLSNATIHTLILEIGVDGRAYDRSRDGIVLEELREFAVVYQYSGGVETFIAGATEKPVRKLDAAARSQFAVPTFPTLREALSNYASESVRESTCKLFAQCWFDENRLFLKASPESIMRDSLTQFLRNRIGGEHDVWPEQIVDESHPVDIRVQTRLANNRLMLIEIKWLGLSAASDGHITARHGEGRAQQGADQLAQYLDDQRHFAPTNVVHGFYVIIDARRKGLQQGVETISQVDGMYFESRDLEFDPDYSKVRKDFDLPYRMFTRPICH